MTNNSLNFENPPLIEVTFSIQFDPLAQLSSTVLGVIWSEFKTSFSQLQEQPALSASVIVPPPTSENKENYPQFMVNPPGAGHLKRIIATSADKIRVMQIQNNKVILNWRKIDTETLYPGFDSLKTEFESICSKIFATIKTQPNIQFSELIYSNHVLLEAPETYQEIFPFAKPISLVPEATPVEINLAQTSQWVERLGGPVEVSSQTRIRPGDQQKISLFQINTKSLALKGQQELAKVGGALDKAHEVVVDSFMQCTSSEIKESWGYQTM